MIVVDASVLANAIGDDGSDGAVARAALAGNDLSVPDLVDVEVVSVLRRRWLAKTMTAKRFAIAVDDLAAVPADRYPVLPFMPGRTSCVRTSAPTTRPTWRWPSNLVACSSPRIRGWRARTALAAHSRSSDQDDCIGSGAGSRVDTARIK